MILDKCHSYAEFEPDGDLYLVAGTQTFFGFLTDQNIQKMTSRVRSE